MCGFVHRWPSYCSPIEGADCGCSFIPMLLGMPGDLNPTGAGCVAASAPAIAGGFLGWRRERSHKGLVFAFFGCVGHAVRRREQEGKRFDGASISTAKQ